MVLDPGGPTNIVCQSKTRGNSEALEPMVGNIETTKGGDRTNERVRLKLKLYYRMRGWIM